MAEMQANSQTPDATGPPDRRRYPRVQCRLPAELRLPHSSFPLQVETTDVSLGGCYVATMYPMAKGTIVDFRCWVAETSIACKAVIRTFDPGVGNGIEFIDLDGLSTTMLSAYLDSLASKNEQALQPIGIIHSRM